MISDGPDRAVDELRAVVKGMSSTPCGQGLFDLLDALLDALDDRARVLALEHHRDAGDDLALAVGGDRALADRRARDDLAEVAHVDRARPPSPVLTTMFAMSSVDSTRPMPRSRYCSAPFSM